MATLEEFQTSLKDLAKTNPAAAGIIASGTTLIIFAVAVSISPKVLEYAGPVTLWTIGIGFLVVVLGYISTHRVLMPLVASCLIVIGIAYGIVLGLNQAMPGNQLLGCLASLTDCKAGADASAAEAPGSDKPLAPDAIVLPAATGCSCDMAPSWFPQYSGHVEFSGPGEGLPPPPAATFSQQVYVQFAGAITRDAVRTFMEQLKAAGWNVQGVEGGGERTTKADGLSEVRYASADKDAADALVALLNAWRVIERTFEAKENGLIQPGSLEIWMGR